MLKSYIEQLAAQLSYGTDFGISIEIKDFFKEDERVSEYQVEVIDGKKYRVTVKLKEHSLQEAKKVFSDFLHFIEYPGTSFYVRKNTPETIEYLLLSADEDKAGFYCQVLFEHE